MSPPRMRPLAALGLVLSACTASPAREAGHERFLRAPDGLPLAYEERGAGEPALVLVHGWCCDRAFWREQIDQLARERRVVALDLAGHGSSGDQRDDWTLPRLGADVAAAVESLRIESVILVGHSMGGPVALEAARSLGPRVRGVIGVDTLHDAGFCYPDGMLEEVARSFERDFRATMELSVASLFPPETDPALVDWVLERALVTDPTAAVALLRGFEGYDLARTLAATRVPIRCINAAPRAGGLATAIEKNRRLADFDAVLIEGVGHYPMLERPGEFNARLEAWLAELCAP